MIIIPPENVVSFSKLHLIRSSSSKDIQSSLVVYDSIYNGKMVHKRSSGEYIGKYADCRLYLTDICEYCRGSRSVRALYDGRLIFLCIGASCLNKIKP